MPQSFADDEKKWLFRTSRCFACGTENETGLAMALYQVGERVYADYRVPKRFRGLSKVAHGGIVCTLLDEVTVSGSAHLLNEMCVTTQMTVRFKKPLLLESPVQLVSWIARREGRKVVSHGEIRDERDEVVASAEAHMFVLDPETAKRFLRSESAEKMKEVGKGTR